MLGTTASLSSASFMIHGNHDDPGGESNLCAANLLEVDVLRGRFGIRQHDSGNRSLGEAQHLSFQKQKVNRAEEVAVGMSTFQVLRIFCSDLL